MGCCSLLLVLSLERRRGVRARLALGSTRAREGRSDDGIGLVARAPGARWTPPPQTKMRLRSFSAIFDLRQRMLRRWVMCALVVGRRASTAASEPQLRASASAPCIVRAPDVAGKWPFRELAFKLMICTANDLEERRPIVSCTQLSPRFDSRHRV